MNVKVTNTYIMQFGNQLLEEIKEEEQEGEELLSSVSICGANLSTPVIDKAYYISEIKYRIGDRLYAENAD